MRLTDDDSSVVRSRKSDAARSRSRAKKAPRKPAPKKPPSKKRVAARKVTRAKPRTDTLTISMRAAGCNAHEFAIDRRALEREAAYWTSAVYWRERWRSSANYLRFQGELAAGTLVDELGFDAGVLEDLSGDFELSRALEVVFPADAPLALRRMPWEYLLKATLAPAARELPAVIVRRLAGPDEKPPPSRGRNAPAYYVECLPGPELEHGYLFDEERALAKELSLAFAPRKDWPTLQSIRGHVERAKPQVVHVAGFDLRQAHALGNDAPPKIDGVTLGGPRDLYGAVEAGDFARALTAGARKPELVVFNVYHSGASLAFEAVAAGARAAIGFQDYVDDTVAEQFIRELYRARGYYADEKGERTTSLVEAFLAAIGRVRELSVSLRGAGIVLWTRGSELDDPPSALRALTQAERDKSGASPVRMSATPHEEVNFALLHNGRSLFHALTLARPAQCAIDSVNLKVSLEVANEPYVYDATHALEAHITDVAPRVTVPVTWLRDRWPSESVRTTLRAELAHDATTRKSWPVSLLSPDSWRDDDENRQWLPSFVLPRDPAVRDLLALAQPHLDALSDDPGSSFSGYQAIDPELDDPYERVDLQAQAIWMALVIDVGLRYVNPPPSYQVQVQRLRPPSAVLREGRGTCIDLALLYAACLEYVGIDPVLFLLEGHAFVGYWRSEEEGLFSFLEKMLAQPTGGREPEVGTAWLFDAQSYEMIWSEVHRTRQLVPLEATLLAGRAGFREGAAEGHANLQSKKDFHSMMDIWLARDHRVTPLPFLESAS